MNATTNISQTVPAVTYQVRANGAATRVQREGKGGHVSLIRDGRVERIVVAGTGIVGFVGRSSQANAWCVQLTGALDFTATAGFRTGALLMGAYATRDEAIGEIGLAFLS